jgi:hypothetical protein
MYVRKQNQTIPSIDISTAPILNSQWNHCVIIYDSNLNTLQCIINNSELYNSNFAIGGAPNFINDNQFQIGGRQFNNTNYYNGQIDDIGIWNRALTQEEITALYNGCSDLITAQPSAQTVTLSESNAAQFTVNSPATNPGYQWQTNLGLGFQNLSDAGQYSGSATNILTVNNLSISNNNQQFRCIVSEGTCADTTDAAALTIIDDLGFENLNMSGTEKLVKITDLNGKETPFKKNNVLLFIYEDGTVERVYEAE